MHQLRVIQQANHMKVVHEWDEKDFHELMKDESCFKKEEQDLEEQQDCEEEQDREEEQDIEEQDLKEQQDLREQQGLEEEDPLQEKEDAQSTLRCIKCRQGQIFFLFRNNLMWISVQIFSVSQILNEKSFTINQCCGSGSETFV